MLGAAALAMWWDISPELRPEFEHWHSHEHFAERLALPGFLRGSRWADAAGGEGFFILYELSAYEALVSPEYLARLNAPSDWSRRMMPHHRNMVRSPCRVLATRGGAVAGHALTVRLSPRADAQPALRQHLIDSVGRLPLTPGITGAQLLCTEVPQIAATTEQKIRGLADRAADWVLLVQGYEAQALDGLAGAALSPSALQAAGAREDVTSGRYSLRLSMVASEPLRVRDKETGWLPGR